jgi:hypothetical protein
MQLAERIERLLIYRDAAAAHDPNVQRELVDIWRILGKDLCRTCQDKLYSAMVQLRSLNITAMAKRVSELHAGQFIMVPFTSDPYTNANLTDAAARRLLKEYPPIAASFKTLPPEEPVEGDEDYRIGEPTAPKGGKKGKKEAGEKEEKESDRGPAEETSNDAE